MSIRDNNKGASKVEGRRSKAGGRCAAFTLFEVMIGVMIISLIMIALYRFVQANLLAIQVSTEISAERQQMEGLVNFVQGQLEDLPRGQGVLMGNASKLHDLANDEMQWVCQGGEGVLTTAAPDLYRVTLAIQPSSKTGSTLEIGLRRQTVDSAEKDYDWLPLLRPAAAMEIRYFDPRLNAPIERWNDQNVRPPLVYLRIWKTSDSQPYEAVLRVPSAVVQAR